MGETLFVRTSSLASHDEIVGRSDGVWGMGAESSTYSGSAAAAHAQPPAEKVAPAVLGFCHGGESNDMTVSLDPSVLLSTTIGAIAARRIPSESGKVAKCCCNPIRQEARSVARRSRHERSNPPLQPRRLRMAPAAVGCKRLLGCRVEVYNDPMTSRARELLREALTLPVEERADVAAELLASLDDGSEDPAEVEAAWAAEIERRARGVVAGGSPGASWQDVRNRAESDLHKR